VNICQVEISILKVLNGNPGQRQYSTMLGRDYNDMYSDLDK